MRFFCPRNMLVLALLTLCALPVTHATAAPIQPNILILFADDMGYQDAGCFGGPIKTPHIDQLAREGMRFTDFYAGAPNCSPSRAALMTGRIAARTGIFNYIPPAHGMHLPADEITIARLLQDGGYATGLFGKWHLSHTRPGSNQPKPADYGFDYTFCTRNNAEPSHKDPDNFYRNGKALGKLEGYSCQIVADEAIGWLKKREDNAPPFFAYVAFHEPHKKLASPPDLVDKYKGMGKRDALYFANIANLDRAIGRILHSLDTLGLSKDPFVLFASDNGPWREGSQGPLRGKKSDLWDGGIRVPGIMRWPGKIPAGTSTGEPAGVVDMLPTLCTIAGIQPPRDRAIDGTDLTPLFNAKPLVRDTPLFWYFYRVDPQLAMRDGDWTLIGHINDPVKKRSHWLSAEDMPFIKTATPTRFELYNVREDMGQKNNLAESEAERLESMKAAMLKLHKDVVTEGDDWSEAIAGYVRPK
ncbi:MAG: sulfatase-like hydrolase/transferase [Candidatus Hydrogenedentes bacterium]|nr:sulfatase-like hydrolase/transferase [Candidatus Hydrogenedentota bacterium]